MWLREEITEVTFPLFGEYKAHFGWDHIKFKAFSLTRFIFFPRDSKFKANTDNLVSEPSFLHFFDSGEVFENGM